MQCDNNLCIYCEVGVCVLEEVSMDEVGMCRACIQITLDDDILKREKKKLRQRLEE